MPRLPSSTKIRCALLSLSQAAEATVGEYVTACNDVLAALFPSDLIVLNDIDTEARTAHLDGVPRPDPAVGGLLLELAHENPMTASYLCNRGGLAPRRMSDLVPDRAFRRTRTYAELFRPFGAAHQMTILTAKPSSGHGRSWGMNRSLTDYTDDELDIAAKVQQAVALLDEVVTQRGLIEPVARETGPGHDLTRRELEVLACLAQGWTARRIGNALRISERTVGKHLQSIYAKLEVSDRLLAVQAARQAGLVGPASPTASPRDSFAARPSSPPTPDRDQSGGQMQRSAS